MSVTFALPTVMGLPNGTGSSLFLTSWIGAPPASPSAHRRVVVERADDELGRRRGAVDRQLGPVAHEQRQRPAVVEVRVRYHRRVEPVQLPEVRRQGPLPSGLMPASTSTLRRAEVEQVAAAAHLPRPRQGRGKRVGRGLA